LSISHNNFCIVESCYFPKLKNNSVFLLRISYQCFRSQETKLIANSPPPQRTAGLLIQKTLTGVLIGGGSYTWKISSTRISKDPAVPQVFFTTEFGHFLVIIFTPKK
jgi:hypothetical protein